MEYILDGYNIIKSSFLKKAETRYPEDGRNALYLLMSSYRHKHPAVTFTVVFDGQRSSADGHGGQGASVFYSGDISADDKIRLLLERKRNPHLVTVVSDDREVQASARVRGCRAAGVAEFLNLVAPPPSLKSRKKPEKKMDYVEMASIEKELRSFYETRNDGRRTKETSPTDQGAARPGRRGP